MSTPVQDTLVDVAAMAAPTVVPSREASVRGIKRAIAKAASDHHGHVHASWVRPYLPPVATQSLIGAVTGALIQSGHLVPSNRPALPNGGGSGNANKLSRVWRLAKNFTAEEIRP